MDKTIKDIAPSPTWIVSIAQSLAGLVDLRAAVTAMSEELNALIQHDHIDVALLSETRDSLIVYETGLETSWGNELCRVEVSPIREILYGQVDHMIFEDAVQDDRVQFTGADNEPIQTFGLRSRLHHKIEISGVIVGALSVSSLRPNAYFRDHLAVIRTVANVVGPYFHALRVSELAQTRALELERQKIRRDETEHLVEIQEKERNRIGMDLHDQVLADMSRLLRGLDDDRVPSAARLRDAQRGLSLAIQDIRDIVEDARPTLLEMFGLGTAVEAYLQRSTKGADIQAVMSSSPEEMDKSIFIRQRDKLLLYRIIQEAINNAVNHANASLINVSLHRKKDQAVLTIEDDGAGFTLSPDLRQSGLKNMSARAAMIGAQLQLSTHDRGTKVAITIDCRPKEQ